MKISIEVDAEQVMFRLNDAQYNLAQKRQEFVRELTRRLMSRVIERTPVDTGRAQSGWNGGVGEEQDNDLTTMISVTNDVEYIGFLEFGTSRMPARAMVRSSMSQSQSDVCSIPLNVFEL
ncbi:MAG: HK97 gp10 family phage protein [Planctomycetaceae bacterium]|nr:HK97 gp10 family phage protein [Planctomycetaceae bacterium]